MSDFVGMAQNLGIRGTIQGPEFRARCPFHADKSPSFSLNISSGAWICFRGCGKGDFIRLVEMVLNCGSGEARTWIQSNGAASTIAVAMEATAARINMGFIDRLPEVLNEDWKGYYNSLNNNSMPMWFVERGFNWETINHWGLRYDMALDAVVIPVYFEKELVGIISRNTLPYLPKYENSNFHKSKVLFGEISGQRSLIIICEGVLDAIWLWQNGYHAVSILGSELSKDQIDILRRYRFGEIVLALDNDDAGKIGTKNAIRYLTNAGWLLPQISIIRFPNEPYKKDANDCDSIWLRQLFQDREGVIHNELFA